VVLDSVANAEHSYGAALGGLVPYQGDSSLFIDRGSISMLVLDGTGTIVRVRAAPTSTYLSNLTSGNTIPGTDPSGRLVIRIKAKPTASFIPIATASAATGSTTTIEPDTSFMVRMHIDTRVMDTAAVVRIPRVVSTLTKMENGAYMSQTAIDPFPTTDEWAVLPDGTIAIVRGRDYHVEFLDDHNTITIGPKLPFEWARLTDDERGHIVDSIKASQARATANQYFLEMVSWVNSYKQVYPPSFTLPLDAVPPGLPSNWILPAGFTLPADYVRGPASTPPAGQLPSKVPPMPTPETSHPRPPQAIVPMEQWPDYKPPFSAGSVRSDGDGDLWIRINLMHPVAGGAIYDIVNRKGELVDRIQLPVGHTLVGFGAGHIVYTTFHDAGQLYLERIPWK
jgi:hypothetical protein